MNRILTFAMVGLVLVVEEGYSQGITLNAGDSQSIEFTSLPYAGIRTMFPAVPTAGFLLTLSDYDPAVDTIVFKMFENNLSEAPLFTSINNPPGVTSGGLQGSWQDLQGWVSLEVASGSVTWNTVQFDVYTPLDANNVNHYSEIVAVPEPGSGALGLLLVGLLSGSAWFRRRT